MLAGIGDQLLARVQVPDPPGGDDGQLGIEGQIAQFKADLVVAFAGGAVADRVGVLLGGDAHLLAGDERPGKRGAEQVGPFVDGVGPEGREDVIAHEFLAQVGDDHLVRAGGHALGPDLVPVLLLTDVGTIGDHRASVFIGQPLEDDRGVQPAGVGEHDFLNAHDIFLKNSGEFDGCVNRPQCVPPARNDSRIALWRCILFSAWSKTTLRGPSSTSSVISSPRWAGRQWRTMASSRARASSSLSNW